LGCGFLKEMRLFGALHEEVDSDAEEEDEKSAAYAHAYALGAD